MKPVLLIGHPGHELRIWEWVRHARPDVVMLTNGEGSIGMPRLQDSMQGLTEVGVRIRTDWLQPVPDGEVYRALLGETASPLPDWVDRLQRGMRDAGVDLIVADAAEGYNPTHDLCRAMANQLVLRLRADGHEVANLEFPLVGHPSDPARRDDLAVRVDLDGEALRAKIQRARDYARRCSPRLMEEVEAAFSEFGEAAFGVECLYRAQASDYEENEMPVSKPHFEVVGEQRLAQGVYHHVIRAEHLRRLIMAMRAG